MITGRRAQSAILSKEKEEEVGLRGGKGKIGLFLSE